MFRVIPAEVFVANFSSDRSHMIDHNATNATAAKGSGTSAQVLYLKPLPPWGPIRGAASETATNLDRFICMEKGGDPEKYGVVMNVQEFVAFGRS
jgi:hypothetical protein